MKLLPVGTQTLYFAPDGLFQMLGIEYLASEDLKGLEMRRLSSTAQIVPRQVGLGKKTVRKVFWLWEDWLIMNVCRSRIRYPYLTGLRMTT